jgi:hypothetical protein
MGINGVVKRKGYNMSKGIGLPGFPPPEKQDNVEFYFLKKLSYSDRVLTYLILVALGFLAQIASMKAWTGIILLIFATMLNLIKGCDNNFIRKAYKIDKNWTPVNMDQINRIEEIERKAAKWDKDILDISNAKGCLSFLITICLIIFGYTVLRRNPYFKAVLGIIIIDSIILIFPLWFNGLRRVLKQNKLHIKVDIIKKMEEFFQTIKQDGELFKPELLLARDKRGMSVPTDSRFTITFDNMPEGFYGIQAQINLNKVESSLYPYFYCVIAAKKGFGLMRYIKSDPENKKVLVVYEGGGDAEVIVIRQRTTNSSGYHTKYSDCKRILELSLVSARDILSKHRTIR